jgi:hypothetical protein
LQSPLTDSAGFREKAPKAGGTEDHAIAQECGPRGRPLALLRDTGFGRFPAEASNLSEPCSIVNEAGFCRGGKSLNDLMKAPTAACATRN